MCWCVTLEKILSWRSPERKSSCPWLPLKSPHLKKQTSIYRRHTSLSETHRWPSPSPNHGIRGRGSDMFASTWDFGRTEWNLTVYFIRSRTGRFFPETSQQRRWAAARHSQLFLLFLFTRLKKKKDPKNTPWDHLQLHSLCVSFLDALTGESGSECDCLLTHLHKHWLFPWCTANKTHNNTHLHS